MESTALRLEGCLGRIVKITFVKGSADIPLGVIGTSIFYVICKNDVVDVVLSLGCCLGDPNALYSIRANIHDEQWSIVRRSRGKEKVGCKVMPEFMTDGEHLDYTEFADMSLLTW